MATITTRDGTEIFYKDWGSGQPVVFSHGWPLNADAWDDQAMLVANNGYRAIAHDRRGHGRPEAGAHARVVKLETSVVLLYPYCVSAKAFAIHAVEANAGTSLHDQIVSNHKIEERINYYRVMAPETTHRRVRIGLKTTCSGPGDSRFAHTRYAP